MCQVLGSGHTAEDIMVRKKISVVLDLKFWWRKLILLSIDLSCQEGRGTGLAKGPTQGLVARDRGRQTQDFTLLLQHL